MPKQIAGSVFWIENGKQTNHVVAVKDAFSDPVQAKEQVIHAERMGDQDHLKLARLAFRQFMGKRFRVENQAKPRRATEVDRERISKARIKKAAKPASAKKPVGRKVVRKTVQKTSKKK